MTDADLIAKAEALASADYPGIAVTVEWETARDRHLIRLAELRNAVREQEPSKAMRLLDHVCAVILGHGVIMTRDQIDAATAIIEAALAKAEERGAEREREACVGVADLMGEVGMEMAGDTIMTDPLLHGGEWTDLNCRISRDCTIDGAIYSSRYHASKDIAAAILARGGL